MIRGLLSTLSLTKDRKLQEIIRALWREIHDNNVIEDIAQTAHGFEVGQAVKQTAEGTWVLAQANNDANAGAVGLVCKVKDADTFWIRTGGLLPGEYETGKKYFLSTITAGETFIQANPEVWVTGNYRQVIGTGYDKGLLIEIDERSLISEIGGDSSNTFEDTEDIEFTVDQQNVTARTIGYTGEFYDLNGDVVQFYDEDGNKLIASNGLIKAILPLEGLKITCSSSLSVLPVVDPTNLSSWNQVFDLPNNGTPFNAVSVEGLVVTLAGGKNITLNTALNQRSGIISVIDETGCVIALGASCMFNSTDLESATFDSVVEITEDDVFNGCSKLNDSISFYSLNSIQGDRAFQGCTSLVSPAFQSLTEIIGWSSFQGCTGLVNPSFPELITIGNTVGNSGANTFRACSNLKTPYFPLLEHIGMWCFYDCIGIDDTTIADCFPSLKTAGDIWGSGSFFGCTGLIEPVFETLEFIGAEAFQGCSGLIYLGLPLITSLEGSILQGCASLVEIDIPNVTEIKIGALYNCSSLTTANLDSVLTCLNSAFQGCSSFTTFSLPVATSLAPGCFKN